MIAPKTSATPGPGILNIGQIAVRIHDLQRATAFYKDALGLSFLFATPDLGFFDCGGVRLMLTRPEKSEHDHPGSILYFRVANITESHAILKEKGARLVDEPHIVARMPGHDLWMCFFHDSEDNLCGLMSEVRLAK
jgi:methylmalonyl-CoA/ethylmalonyl-CoA epimerase